MRILPSILFLSTISLFHTACEEGTPEPSCGTFATVRDMTGLDGCGFVFEIIDPQDCIVSHRYLEPIRLRYCGTPPLSEEITSDPLFNFEFVDGKNVSIAYEILNDQVSNCMVRPVVKITCLKEYTDQMLLPPNGGL